MTRAAADRQVTPGAPGDHGAAGDVDWLSDLGLELDRGSQDRPGRRRPRDFGWSDAALLGGSVVASFATVWLVFFQLTLLSGVFGFLLCWYGCFLVVYWVSTAQLLDRPAATDRVVTTIVATAAAAVIGVLVYIVVWVIVHGASHFSAGYLTRTMAYFRPAEGEALFRKIGVAQGIVGTFEEVGIGALVAVPLAFMTAIFLNEVGGPGTRFVRTVVTAMSGIPSVVAGVFVFAVFIEPHVMGYSGFAASLALFVLMLPSVTRTTEEVLRVVPDGLREASLALGASEWRTVRSVVLPTARSGLVTAVVLGVAIAAGETAPLLFTAFGNNSMNTDEFHGAQGALPLIVYDYITAAQQVVVQLAFTTAFVLLAIVLTLFVVARLLGRRPTGRGPARRLVAAAADRMRRS